MACERYGEELAAVAAGGPPSVELGGHLGHCEACREELATLRRALDLVDQEIAFLRTEEPSPELAVRIRRAVAEREAPARRPGWLWPAAGLVAALLLVLTVWPGRPSGRASPTGVALDTRPSPLVPTPPAAADARSRDLEVPAAPREPDAEATVVPRGFDRTGHAGSAGTAEVSPHAVNEPGRDDGPSLPEVLVPPGESEALLRLVTLVHHERLTLPVLSAAGEPSAELAALVPLQIAPIEIVPLGPPETD